MTTKRERLNALTTTAYEIIDEAKASAATPNSVAAVNADIDSVTADIAVLTAIPVASRTAVQKVDLAHLRHVLTLLRGQRSAIRNTVTLARLILLLDGSRARNEDVQDA